MKTYTVAEYMKIHTYMDLEANGPKAALQLLHKEGVVFANLLKALDPTKPTDKKLLQNRLILSLHRMLNLAEAAPAASASAPAPAPAPPLAAASAAAPPVTRRRRLPQRGVKRSLE